MTDVAPNSLSLHHENRKPEAMSQTLRTLADVHTHHAGKTDALLSVPPDRVLQEHPRTPYSLSLHPWYAGPGQLDCFRKALESCLNDPFCQAIGECGLDNRCDTPFEWQLEAFRSSLIAARERNKPVIIHCVGYWDETVRLLDELLGKPADGQPYEPLCVIHGYRKGPQLALRLLSAGCCFSLGEKFNPEVARLVPDDRLFFETDESQEDIWNIRKKIVNLRAENR
jgi:TatD DNase family protein